VLSYIGSNHRYLRKKYVARRMIQRSALFCSYNFKVLFATDLAFVFVQVKCPFFRLLHCLHIFFLWFLWRQQRQKCGNFPRIVHFFSQRLQTEVYLAWKLDRLKFFKIQKKFLPQEKNVRRVQKLRQEEKKCKVSSMSRGHCYTHLFLRFFFLKKQCHDHLFLKWIAVICVKNANIFHKIFV
jgi:hypothetical protein